MTYMSVCNPDEANPIGWCAQQLAVKEGQCIGQNGLTIAVPPPPSTTPTPTPEPCNTKFSGFTTCAVLNGLSYTTTDAQTAMQRVEMEWQMQVSTKSQSCEAILYKLMCIQFASIYGLSIGTCEPIKACFELCVEYVRICIPEATEAFINSTSGCALYRQPEGASCFGTNGWIPSVTPWTPPPPPPPTTTSTTMTPPPEPITFGTYSGLTTCAVLNGARMRDRSETYIFAVENMAKYSYENDMYVNKSDACQKFFYDVYCVETSRTVTSTGEPIQICYQWCLQYSRACVVDSSCRSSAPPGAECFGNNGTFGMKQVTTPPPTTTTPLVTTTPVTTTPPPPCNKRVPALTTCSILEGLPIQTTDEKIAEFVMYEWEFERTYNYSYNNGIMPKSNRCRTLFYTFNCLTESHTLGVCMSPTDNTRLKVCIDLCIEYYRDCRLDKDKAHYEEYCPTVSTSSGWCFGNDKVQFVTTTTPVPTTSTTPAPTTSTTPAPTTTTPEPRKVCSSKYANLTTCAVLNGAPTLASEVNGIWEIEKNVPTSYNAIAGKSIENTTACRLLYYTWTCMYHGHACTNTSEKMLPCFELCAQVAHTCTPLMENTTISSACMSISAPSGTQCFGSNGVLGMKVEAPFVCPENSTSTGKATRLYDCYCNAGFYGKDGICSECPLNSNSTSRTTALSGCLCKPGHGSNF